MSAIALGERISSVKKDRGLPLKNLTVLSTQRDPYRLDTPANHAKAIWLLDSYNEVHEGGRIHLRGLHYKFVGQVTLPDGNPYINTDEIWLWMSEQCATAARFLGYLPWDAIRDARNSPPQIFTPEYTEPAWYLSTADVELTLPDDLEPQYRIYGDMHWQPWRQIVIAEKQGVEELLLPVCRRREATLCLPGGEISTQLVYDMLADAAKDGRPTVIHSLGDFDPAGWQMAVSTARKVQALVDTQFPDLQVRVHAIGLTLEQCEEWDLPSSPLKETEKRGTAWKAAMGREQTELDAAVALRPHEFARMVDSSLLQYYDPDVASKGQQFRQKLEDQANERLADTLDPEAMARIRSEAQEKLSDLEDLADEVNEALQVSPDDIGMESPDDPDPLIGETDESELPLIDTLDDWLKNTTALRRRKRYE